MTSADGVRIKVNAALAALILTLLSGAFGVVWAAATLKAAVESYRASNIELRQTLYVVVDKVGDLSERVTVLEDRTGRPTYPRSMLPRDRDRKAIP